MKEGKKNSLDLVKQLNWYWIRKFESAKESVTGSSFSQNNAAK